MVPFLYVKYISPQKGFGLFSGEEIPYKQGDFTGLCLGTYGGMICGAEREGLYPKQMYSQTNGHLPRPPVFPWPRPGKDADAGQRLEDAMESYVQCASRH